MGVLVKTNMRDGFKGGLEIDDCLAVAREIERCGVHAMVLSGGFVSKAPMYVMRGRMPVFLSLCGSRGSGRHNACDMPSPWNTYGLCSN